MSVEAPLKEEEDGRERFSTDWYESKVNEEVWIFWPLDKLYYPGTIIGIFPQNSLPCRVQYEDGEFEDLDLRSERFTFTKPKNLKIYGKSAKKKSTKPKKHQTRSSTTSNSSRNTTAASPSKRSTPSKQKEGDTERKNTHRSTKKTQRAKSGRSTSERPKKKRRTRSSPAEEKEKQKESADPVDQDGDAVMASSEIPAEGTENDSKTTQSTPNQSGSSEVDSVGTDKQDPVTVKQDSMMVEQEPVTVKQDPTTVKQQEPTTVAQQDPTTVKQQDPAIMKQQDSEVHVKQDQEEVPKKEAVKMQDAQTFAASDKGKTKEESVQSGVVDEIPQDEEPQDEEPQDEEPGDDEIVDSNQPGWRCVVCSFKNEMAAVRCLCCDTVRYNRGTRMDLKHASSRMEGESDDDGDGGNVEKPEQVDEGLQCWRGVDVDFEPPDDDSRRIESDDDDIESDDSNLSENELLKDLDSNSHSEDEEEPLNPIADEQIERKPPKKRPPREPRATPIKHKKHNVKVKRLGLDEALQTANSGMVGWSEARKYAYRQIHKNPESYYYRFNAPGEKQKTGHWTEEEEKLFMKRLTEVGPQKWGLFSMAVPGRNGLSCSGFYRKLVLTGKVKDQNYIIDKENKLRWINPKNKYEHLHGRSIEDVDPYLERRARSRHRGPRKRIRSPEMNAFSESEEESGPESDLDPEMLPEILFEKLLKLDPSSLKEDYDLEDTGWDVEALIDDILIERRKAKKRKRKLKSQKRKFKSKRSYEDGYEGQDYKHDHHANNINNGVNIVPGRMPLQMNGGSPPSQKAEAPDNNVGAARESLGSRSIAIATGHHLQSNGQPSVPSYDELPEVVQKLDKRYFSCCQDVYPFPQEEFESLLKEFLLPRKPAFHRSLRRRDGRERSISEHPPVIDQHVKLKECVHPLWEAVVSAREGTMKSQSSSSQDHRVIVLVYLRMLKVHLEIRESDSEFGPWNSVSSHELGDIIQILHNYSIPPPDDDAPEEELMYETTARVRNEY